MDLFEEITSDPRYSQGKQFIRDRKYEESINMFSSLLQSCNESHGETSIQSARAYYEYGNALLIKEEEDPSDDLIGPRDSKSFVGGAEGEEETTDDNKAVPPSEKAEEDEEKEGEGEEENEDDEEEKGDDMPEEAEESDLQVAWEVLDLARVILEKAQDSKYDALLAEVYIRLGDLMKMNGTLSAAIEEYSKALETRSRISPMDHRIISNIHYLLAVAYIYQASEQKDSPSSETRRAALQHYEQSQKYLQQYIQCSSSSSSSQTVQEAELREVQELVEELKETIDALAAEIAELEGAGKSKEPLSSTTIGFGGSSSSLETKRPVAPVQEVTSLQVRKKQKTSNPPSEPDK